MENKEVKTLIMQELEVQQHPIIVLPFFQDNTPMHRHTFAEIAVILEGKCLHRTIRDTSPMVQGDVLLVPYGAIHAYEEVDNLRLVNVLFKPDQIPLIPEIHRIPLYGDLFMGGKDKEIKTHDIRKLHLNEKDMPEICEVLNKMLGEYKSEKPGNRSSILGYFLILLIQILRSVNIGVSTRETIPENIVKVIAYMRKHYPENISLKDLVKISNMSLSSFMREFTGKVGTAPMSFLTEIRISQSCSMLQGSKLSVSEIAQETGFNDSNYFSRVFRKHLGVTPREFRSTCG